MKFQLVQNLLVTSGQWIAWPDIGKQVGDVFVSEEIYEDIEKEVGDFFDFVLKETGATRFCIEGFECWPNAASSLGAEAEDLQKFWALMGGVSLEGKVLESLIRLAYRQLIWLKVIAVGTSGRVQVSFGQDGNLHVVAGSSEGTRLLSFKGRYLIAIE